VRKTHSALYEIVLRQYSEEGKKPTTRFETGSKNHPCADCGESDIVVLEFDHQRDKVADVSLLARDGYSLDKIKREIDKCEVVCANCHRRRTAKQFGTYRYRLG